MKWLTKLGEVTINWGEIKYGQKIGGKGGNNKRGPYFGTKDNGTENINENESGDLVWILGKAEINPEIVETNSYLTKTQTEELQPMLSNFREIFNKPKGLPSSLKCSPPNHAQGRN